MNLVLVVTLVGSMCTTSYRSVPNQTDDSPFITSIGERVNSHGIAISRDLLRSNGGPLDYGDLVYIEDVGFKIVNDTMNVRHNMHVDVWVENYEEEKAFDKRFRGRKLKLWKIKRNPNEKAQENDTRLNQRTIRKQSTAR